MLSAPEASAGWIAAPPTIATALTSRPASLKKPFSWAMKNGERSPILIVPTWSLVSARATSHGNMTAPAVSAALRRSCRRVNGAKSMPTVSFFILASPDDDQAYSRVKFSRPARPILSLRDVVIGFWVVEPMLVRLTHAPHDIVSPARTKTHSRRVHAG